MKKIFFISLFLIASCGTEERYEVQSTIGIDTHCKEFKSEAIRLSENCPENAITITSDAFNFYIECTIKE